MRLYLVAVSAGHHRQLLWDLRSKCQGEHSSGSQPSEREAFQLGGERGRWKEWGEPNKVWVGASTWRGCCSCSQSKEGRSCPLSPRVPGSIWRSVPSLTGMHNNPVCCANVSHFLCGRSSVGTKGVHVRLAARGDLETRFRTVGAKLRIASPTGISIVARN